MNKLRRVANTFALLLLITLFAIPPGLASSYGSTTSGDSETSSQSSPWPMFGLNAQHTALSSYSGPTSPTVKWTFQTGDIILGSASVGLDGTIYFGSADRNLYALYSNGSLKWKHWIDYINQGSPAIGSDGSVYVGSKHDKFYAFNPDGTIKWTFNAIGWLGVPTIAQDGTIYVGSTWSSDANASSTGFGFYALNPDGTLKWKHESDDSIDGGVNAAPAIGTDGTIYVCTYAKANSPIGHLIAFSPEGSIKWSYRRGDHTGAWPVVGNDGTIYIRNDADGIDAIDAASGTLKWRQNWGGATCPIVGKDGTLYLNVGSYLVSPFNHSTLGEPAFLALNQDRSSKWVIQKGEIGTGSYGLFPYAIDKDGIIYAVDYYAEEYPSALYALYPNGTLKWELKNIGEIGYPIIGPNDTIYFGSWDHKFYCVGEVEVFQPLSFNITTGEKVYSISLRSNSSISELNFDQTLRELRFNVTGSSGTTGFCNITVPADLFLGEISLYKDGELLTKNIDYRMTRNETHIFLDINYFHSAHMISIKSDLEFSPSQSPSQKPTISPTSSSNSSPSASQKLTSSPESTSTMTSTTIIILATASGAFMVILVTALVFRKRHK